MTNSTGATGKGQPLQDHDSANRKVAVVQCETFRCLAYRDAEKTWCDFHSGKELPEVKSIIFEFPV